MGFSVDANFRNHFRNLKQVFLYVINECNLDCPQCIYKPDNLFTIGNKEIPFDTAIKLLSTFYQMGARKLTLLGGEPTLYGNSPDSDYNIADLVYEAKTMGYSYVRMDTNGVFEPSLLDSNKLKMIDEISFSIDGYDEETNDAIRGKGSFSKAVTSINTAVKLGYYADITCCVHEKLLERVSKDEYILERFIYMAEKLLLNRVNFHALVKDGTPIDTWTGDLQVSIKKWVDVYDAIENNISNKKYKVGVRIPKTFISKDEFNSNPKYYGFCPAKLGERVLVHPNGIIRICSGLLCSAYCVANYNNGKITWNNGLTNELRDHDLHKYTPCTNRSKKDYGNFYPLCFSFKPKQNEYVYMNLLKWELNNC